MAFRNKLKQLSSKRLYYTIDAFVPKRAYKVMNLNYTDSKLKPGSKCIIVTFQFKDGNDLEGFCYLPVRYVNDENCKLTETDVSEMNDEIKDSTKPNWYLVRPEDFGDQSTICLMDDKEIEEKKIPIYDDIPPAPASPVKRERNDQDDPRQGAKRYSPYKQ